MDKNKIKTRQAFIRIIKIENSMHEKSKSAQDIKLYHSALKCNNLWSLRIFLAFFPASAKMQYSVMKHLTYIESAQI